EEFITPSADLPIDFNVVSAQLGKNSNLSELVFKNGFEGDLIFKNGFEGPLMALGQTLSVDEDISLAIELQTSGGASGTPTYQIIDPPTQGTLTGTAPDLTYQPNLNFNGIDQFTWLANDGIVNSSLATISITINPINDAPTATEQSINLNEDETRNITLAGTDVDDDELSFLIDSQPINGTLSGTLPNLVYSPNANFNGSDSFSYRANDGMVDSDAAIVFLTIMAVNDRPIADPVNLNTAYQSPVVLPLSANDPEDANLIFQIQDQPQNGSITEDAGVFTYRPNNGFSGTDDASYVATDTQNLSSLPAPISITVAENQPPVITSTAPTDAVVGIDLAYQVEATGAQVLEFTLENAPQNANINPNTGLISWIPGSEYSTGLTETNTQCLLDVSTNLPDQNAEFILLVDGSGSMSQAHAFIPLWIPALDGQLNGQNIGSTQANSYGLTIFGDVAKIINMPDGALFGDINDVIETTIPWGNLSGGTSTTENLIVSMTQVLDAYQFSEGKSKSIIYLTDEGCTTCFNNPQQTVDLQQRLITDGIVLHGIINEHPAFTPIEISCDDGTIAMGLTVESVGYVADGQGGFYTCGQASITQIAPRVLTHHVEPTFATGGTIWNIEFLRGSVSGQQSLSKALASAIANSTANQLRFDPLADIYFKSVSYDEILSEISLTVSNRGMTDITTSELSVFNGTTLLETVSLNPLAVNAEQILVINWSSPDLSSINFELSSPDLECDTNNNTMSLAFFDVSASDPDGLNDSQQFFIDVVEVNDPPQITQVPQTDVLAGIPYSAMVVAQDNDKGDAISNQL
ncbi:MAG: Ig-like domain-containing protein, partial [Candidatus Marinimicrobia bacterium]|nr:Ig-like domain-containing protein [Candidatus Neomarinimicrobiota bacterium]